MRSIFKNLRNGRSLLHCAFVLEWRGLVIASMSWLNRQRFHNLVNQHTLLGARKILQIAKANYSIEYLNEATFDKKKNYIFMSNHQSLFDVVLIFATCPGTIRMITKAELFRIPILGSAMYKSGCIPIDRKNVSYHHFLQKVQASLKAGISLWFFPEGTRSPDGNLLPFKTGGVRIASETDTEIVPVGITNTRAIMPPKKFSITYNQDIKIKIGEPIRVGPLENAEALQNKVNKVREVIKQLILK